MTTHKSLAGLEAFDGNRATAIESLKARLEAQMECNLKLTRRIAGLVTELGEWLALADHQGLSTNSHRDRTRAALAAQPPAQGITDGELLDELQRLVDEAEANGNNITIYPHRGMKRQTVRQHLAALRAERGGK